MEWISVKDRLPERGVDVLLVDDFDNMFTGFRSVLPEYEWVDNYGERTEQVTHWMPLPEPPKEEP